MILLFSLPEGHENLHGTASLTLSLEEGKDVTLADGALDVAENGAEGAGALVEEVDANLQASER